VHVFTHHQQVALEHADVWDVLGYTCIETLATDSLIRPSWTDREIFHEHRLEASSHIGTLHHQFRDESRPYFVRSPKRSDADSAVCTIYDALRVARGLYDSKIVTMKGGDFPPPYESAGELGLALLVL